jgi:hypothetical protein
MANKKAWKESKKRAAESARAIAKAGAGVAVANALSPAGGLRWLPSTAFWSTPGVSSWSAGRRGCHARLCDANGLRWAYGLQAHDGDGFMKRGFKNHELVTLAVFFAGGDVRLVDTEDAAVKVNELAPGRFTWRKYREQINIEIVRAFLSDAKKKKYGGLLAGTGATGWQLTDAGLRFAKANASRVATPAQQAIRLSKDERRRRKRELGRVAASDAFHKFAAGKRGQITRREVESVFRLDDYVLGEARTKKVQRLVNVLGDDDEVGNAVRFFARLATKEK